MKWFMKFFGRDDKQITIGSRVRHDGYEGTVVSGAISVMFDTKRGRKSSHHVFNISKSELEIL